MQEDPQIDEVWLVARRRERLEHLAQRLTNARAIVIPLDLSDRSAVDTLVRRLTQAGSTVRVLVNNAGATVGGDVRDVASETLLATVDLNVRAVVQLTKAAVSVMEDGARIIQVASTAAFYPIPGLAVYTAAKAFVLSFTVSLAAELTSRHIRAMVLCPGAVATEFWDVTSRGRLGPPPLIAQRPKSVVRAALRHARWGCWISIPGWLWKLSALLSRCSPWRLSACVVKWLNPLRKRGQ
ncbi:SDR family NAD(P)-dependent oxidoreductase [Myxococcota bacterium]